jgi:hypothetical protein
VRKQSHRAPCGREVRYRRGESYEWLVVLESKSIDILRLSHPLSHRQADGRRIERTGSSPVIRKASCKHGSERIGNYFPCLHLTHSLALCAARTSGNKRQLSLATAIISHCCQKLEAPGSTWQYTACWWLQSLMYGLSSHQRQKRALSHGALVVPLASFDLGLRCPLIPPRLQDLVNQ